MENTSKNKNLTKLNRILKALEGIYEDPESTTGEKLQAIKISLEALEKRPAIKRLSDKDKALLSAIGKNTKKKWGGKIEKPQADKLPEA